MNQGVEWTLHVLLTLAWVENGEPVRAGALAEAHDLPQDYLVKQLQALVRADILESVPGARGGYRLAKPADRITLMDVVSAIEGPQDAFRCTEIRQQGVGATLPKAAFSAPCAISTSMRKAELAWRRELAGQTIADLCAEVDRYAPAARGLTLRAYGH